jgi:hypothetical protein
MSAPRILDVGNGLVGASLASTGTWLSLGGPHSRHGYVELTGLPQFEPAWRGDPTAVRRYRAYMARERFGFLRIELDEPGRHEIATHASPTAPCVEQRHRILGAGRRVVLRFHGRLDAHPLAEITEVDPPAPTRARTRLSADGRRLVVSAAALPARAELRVTIDGGATAGWTIAGGGAQLVVTPARRSTCELVLAIHCSLAEPRAPATPSPGCRLHVPAGVRGGLEALADRARAYVLECTAVRVGPGETCLLTDHRILPLSWTRDAYWQAALLLARAPDGVALETVASHLRWLWTRCERPGGFWMRSHHSNGAPKDLAFQADQQLYPLLELADFRRVAGTLPAPHAGDWWGRRVGELWDALPVGALGLVSSEENAADDASELPFPLSAQILYWLAAVRLEGLREELGLQRDFAAAARAIARAVEQGFRVEGPFGDQWAYEIDGRGGHRLYHDANDLPTALAPLLGFCRADDPLWAATMRFALSEHNPGYCPGRFGGLGSRHTPGTWTLGDLQEWVAASLLGDDTAAERALARLLAVAGPGGLLPEAYDPATGGSPVRPWFAWPGAALGTLLAGGP